MPSARRIAMRPARPCGSGRDQRPACLTWVVMLLCVASQVPIRPREVWGQKNEGPRPQGAPSPPLVYFFYRDVPRPHPAVCATPLPLPFPARRPPASDPSAAAWRAGGLRSLRRVPCAARAVVAAPVEPFKQAGLLPVALVAREHTGEPPGCVSVRARVRMRAFCVRTGASQLLILSHPVHISYPAPFSSVQSHGGED